MRRWPTRAGPTAGATRSAWGEKTKSAYQYTAGVLRTEQSADDRYLVTTKLAGNFPGSPVELKYLFTLRCEVISELDIKP
jgi:hypothetical protein